MEEIRDGELAICKQALAGVSDSISSAIRASHAGDVETGTT
jgi:hypothetical protein